MISPLPAHSINETNVDRSVPGSIREPPKAKLDCQSQVASTFKPLGSKDRGKSCDSMVS